MSARNAIVWSLLPSKYAIAPFQEVVRKVHLIHLEIE